MKNPELLSRAQASNAVLELATAGYPNRAPLCGKPRKTRGKLGEHDLAREHKRLASEAAMPELPDPSLAWEDLSAIDRRALTEMLVDKIIVAPHPTRSSTAGGTTPSAPSHTKIPRRRLSGSRRCTRLGSRSSPGV
jgi:hypothetical protein